MKKNDLILRETNGFNVSNGATTPSRLRIRSARSMRGACVCCPLNGTVARHEYDFSRAIEGGETIIDGNDIDTAPRNIHIARAWTSSWARRAISTNGSCVLDGTLRRHVLPRRGEHRYLSRAQSGESARWHWHRVRRRCAPTCASTIFSTSAMPTAQTSLSATIAISRRAAARYSCQSTTPAIERHRGLGSSTSFPDCFRWGSSSIASRPAGTRSGSTCWWC